MPDRSQSHFDNEQVLDLLDPRNLHVICRAGGPIMRVVYHKDGKSLCRWKGWLLWHHQEFDDSELVRIVVQEYPKDAGPV